MNGVAEEEDYVLEPLNYELDRMVMHRICHCNGALLIDRGT